MFRHHHQLLPFFQKKPLGGTPSFICDALHDLASVTFWHLYYRMNVYECMLMFLYLPVVSIHLYELAWHSNGSIKCQTLECHSNG